jgi:hypothetical protein
MLASRDDASGFGIGASAVGIDGGVARDIADLAEADEFGLGPGWFGLGHGCKLQLISLGIPAGRDSYLVYYAQIRFQLATVNWFETIV